MLSRVVRAVLGTMLLLFGLPLLLVGGLMWFALQHRDDTGGYTAPVSTITTDGYAVVVPDLDDLLRREAPFTRAGRTELRLTAHTSTGPAFLGLAPTAEVAGYLADVPYAQVEEVWLARGPLPVATTALDGVQPPEPPHAQPFWLVTGSDGALWWQPHDLRGQQVALVVMDPTGDPLLSVDITAQVRPDWLTSTTYGLLTLGTLLAVLAIVVLVWPTRPREGGYALGHHGPSAQASLAAQRGAWAADARDGAPGGSFGGSPGGSLDGSLDGSPDRAGSEPSLRYWPWAGSPEPDELAPHEPVPHEPAPHEPVPHEPAPDEPVPHEPAPDEPAPDDSMPEVSTPEVSTPEVPTPEVPTPEVPTPEVPMPEVPMPGETTVDEATADEPAGDESVRERPASGESVTEAPDSVDAPVAVAVAEDEGAGGLEWPPAVPSHPTTPPAPAHSRN